MDIPWRCSGCLQDSMIDLDGLIEWPLDKLVKAQGFTCTFCGAREAVSYSTTSLEEAERKLTRYPPGHPHFGYLFAKLLRKTIGVNARGAELNGAIQRPHMVESRQMG